MTHRIACVVGARPNFMKIAPLLEALREKDPSLLLDLIHTGQHYDDRLSKFLFRDLELPEPDLYLGVGSGSHAEQTAKVMVEFEKYCEEKRPDLVVVVGDVNSTLACSIVAAKLHIPVAHVEAGLRSRDRTMPEEINRIVTDSLSDVLLTTCREADQNLIAEGVSPKKIFFVGNIMIDSLKKHLPKATPPVVLESLGGGDRFGLITLHRPSNVDTPDRLKNLMEVLIEASKELPLIFPVHPRTQAKMRACGFRLPVDLEDQGTCLPETNLWLTPPLGYLEFLYLLEKSRVVFTDSGGIQEETTVLGVPCLTLRENTERPITIEQGTNHLVGVESDTILSTFQAVLQDEHPIPMTPEKWEGGAALEIADILVDWLRSKDR
ncbi:MAG: UDP-N-acetylglucosamine 2-epimerase (non-hydrolyzing) [Candidatus Omnitrophica bacterium]|nr:UDP-N-acetylglucosamine 2-epimerase (non-hydrolyzing) [Candidatus Omnitrophota bacterium]